MPTDIQAIVTAHTRDDIRTHHPQCELDHPVCAILQLAGQIGQLYAGIREACEDAHLAGHRHLARQLETLLQEADR